MNGIGCRVRGAKPFATLNKTAFFSSTATTGASVEVTKADGTLTTMSAAPATHSLGLAVARTPACRRMPGRKRRFSRRRRMSFTTSGK